MGNTVEVTIPVDVEAAQALKSPAHRERAQPALTFARRS